MTVGDTPGADEMRALVPTAAGQTRLVSDPRNPEMITWARETDVRTALTRGLKEYLEQLSITDLNAGRATRLEVEQTWSEPEIFAEYPAVAIYAVGPGVYDARDFTPKTVHLLGAHEDRSIRLVSEFSQSMVVDCWCTDPEERVAVVAMLEDMLNPVDWMTGLRLELPHYHNLRATYELQDMEYLDDEVSAQVRRRRAMLTVAANVTQVRRVGVLPGLDVRFDLKVEDGAC